MKVPRISNAMEYIDEDLISQAADDRPKQKRAFRWKPMAAAACIAVMMGSLFTVQAANGSVSNLLAPLFGIAQTEIVDDIGIPVGVSASADGYTLTADAVIGDRYNVAIVYTLTRDDGQPIEEDLYFKGWKTDVISGASGGGSLVPIENQENSGKRIFVESWKCSKPVIGRYVSASFSDLAINREGADDPVVADGPWELNYTLRYRDSTVKVPVHKLRVTDSDAKEYQINKIWISPIGLSLKGRCFDPQGNHTMDSFQAVIKKTDGTTVLLKEFSKGIHLKEGAQAGDINYQALFPQPIPLDEIETLIICDIEVSIR